ncbi:MAG: endonuclease/exonuclease/phosphatase family protein [Muribaculaceae bacterium]
MNFIRIFTSLFFSASAIGSTWAADTVSSVIMSYNIRNCKAMDDNRNVNLTAETIIQQNPDIVCVQELDSATTRSDGRYTLGELADATAMHPTFAPAIDYQGGKYGIGMLSKKAPLSVKQIALPGREEQRTILIAEFSDFVVACTHLSLTPDDQLLSVPLIVNEAAQWQKPFIICGDFNAKPGSNVIDEFLKNFTIISQTAHPTHPSDHPKNLIDYIMVFNSHAASIKASNAYVVSGVLASDHLPQLVTVSTIK